MLIYRDVEIITKEVLYHQFLHTSSSLFHNIYTLFHVKFPSYPRKEKGLLFTTPRYLLKVFIRSLSCRTFRWSVSRRTQCASGESRIFLCRLEASVLFTSFLEVVETGGLEILVSCGFRK